MRKIFLYFVLFAAAYAQAQSPAIPKAGTEITKAIPSSPDAAALGKFGRTPVGYYTGVPNISIPLYTIKSGDLTLPVSINYHSGGIKVEEQASSVGLGWALNAGGAITRTVRGNVDESSFGYLDAADYVGNVYRALNNQPSTLTLAQAGAVMNKMAEGTYDGEADVFNFNFGGYSGQFSFSQTSGFIISPQQNILFSFAYSPGQHIPSFTAKTPDGVTWYFGSSEGVDAVEYAQRNGNTANQKSYNTSWLLKSIISPMGSRIDFTYKPEVYSQYQPNGTKYRLTSGTGLDTNRSTLRTDDDLGSTTGMHNMKLTGITFENGSLQIYANLKRLDLSTLDPVLQPKMIDTIAITSTGFSKLYKFYYTNKVSSRLRLDSLVGQLEQVTATVNKKEKYSFIYNPDITIGGTMYFNQDWWGYYNGTNQTTLVPASQDPLSSTPLPGANRTPDAGYMTAGMLTSIKYPTNGYTNFFFEPHQTPDYDFGADNYVADPQATAFSNDSQNIYYNYDNRNGNPTHLMHVYNQLNNVPKMAVHLTAYGMRDGNNPPPPLYDLVTARIYGQDAQGNYTVAVQNVTNTDTTIFIPQGYYKVVLLDSKQQTDTTKSNFVKYSIAANWSNHLSLPGQSNYVGHTASGLRIARIEDYDGISTVPYNVRRYTYNLNSNANRSSGFLNYQPSYSYDLTVLTGNYKVAYTHTYFVRTASSNYPMATQSGAVVGYYSVQEYFDKNGVNGKEEYNYDIAGQGVNGPGFPFAPPTQQDWHTGLLLSQVTSRNVNGQLQPVKKKINIYSIINFKSEYNSIKTGFNPLPVAYDENSNYYPSQMKAQPYPTVTDYKYLSSDSTYVYDMNDANKTLKTWNNYQMDPVTYQLTRLQSVNSKNELITQLVTYSNTASPAIRGVNYLNAARIYTYPIEEVTSRSDINGNNARTVNAVLTTYKTNKPFKDTVFVMRSVAPVTNFVTAAGGANRDSRYQPVVAFNKYDAAGNIIQEAKIGDALRSFIWGYKDVRLPYYNTYPIAEVLNADSASIAYTNFEGYSSTGLGNWAYNNAGIVADVTAPMGNGCYTVSSSNTVIKNSLTVSASYIVSFWSKAGAAVTVSGGTVTAGPVGNPKSGWTYREYTVTGTASVTIGGSGLLDELRLYPVNAQMSTYTYQPLVGMASKCDVRNNITYFTYDNVGRLAQVLDQNRSILKDYRYNYAGIDAIWVDVSPQNLQCVKDPNNNNTGEQQKQQVDSNPSSSTYQKTRWLSLGTNTTGCPVPASPTLYVKMTLASTYTQGTDTYNTYRFDVYSDAAGTITYNVLANLTVNYNVTITTRTNGSVTNTTVCNRSVTVQAGTNTISSDAIDVTACITCAGAGGGGGGEALTASKTSASQQSTTVSGGETNVGGGGGTGTTCSSTVALTLGTGYNPKY
ncbi:hypothetical protein A0256_20835 [Mucilaginibacter sp. PAMC 26640]|nr:hypothetical protein A0256_20835 [Mucilaginibacter sp. PAMC 26640]